MHECRGVLREYYGLSADRLTRTAEGVLNETYLVATDQGRFFCKRYVPKLYQRDQIQRATLTQARLSAVGLPVPAPLLNREGRCVTETEGGSFVVMPWVEGRSHPRGAIPPTAAVSMGHELGQLHRELAKIDPIAHRMSTPAVMHAKLTALLDAAERGTDALDALATEALRRKLVNIERLAPMYPAFVDLPGQWIHGDYQETNILFDSTDRIVGIVDFDALRCRPRGNEVMRALSICFAPWAPEAFAFFGAYASVVMPSPTEVGLYAALGAYSRAIGTWPFQERYTEPEVYQSRWDRFLRPPNDWWEETDRLTENLLAQLPQ